MSESEGYEIRPPTRALVGGRIIDGNGGDPLEDGVIVIDGGVITAVGASGSTAVPEGAEIVDVAGRTLIPGMFDLHVHLGGTPYRAVALLAKALGAGFTTIAHVASNQPEVTVPLRDAIEIGFLPQCSRLLAGAVVSATNGHVAGRTADGPWEVRKAVREMVEQGADFIKTAASGGFASEHEECWWQDYTFEELEALVDEIHGVGRKAVVHVHTQPGLNHTIRAGADQIHHGAFIDEEALVGIKEKGLYFVPTLRVSCKRNIAIKIDAGRPWEARKMEEAHDGHREGVRRAHELGVKLAYGTDLPGTPPWDTDDAAWELIELVGCGLSEMEAITVATRNSADAAGVLDRLGTLEPGKQGDVVVIDGDPLEDISVIFDRTNIRKVLKDGRIAIDRDRGHFGGPPVRASLDNTAASHP
jgi:imidazolonepropionase-like amidohydrolase